MEDEEIKDDNKKKLNKKYFFKKKIYVKNADGTPKLDTHGHLIVKHDLFNHDGLTKDGIAEAFIEFAKKERLSFFL